jgi:hypothetical protein
MNNQNESTWNAYCEQEIRYLTPFLTECGYTLDKEQPHIKGERFLMHAVTTTSGTKLILLGTHANGNRVVIKASRDNDGIREINHERLSRQVLNRINFARDTFHTPTELMHAKHGGFVINIQSYIEQEKSFLERPLKEQFTFALSAFEGQEGAHAATYAHERLIKRFFGIRDAHTYVHSFLTFKQKIEMVFPQSNSLHSLYAHAYETLTAKEVVINQYSNFLTHTDFVPHNFRINGNTIYLLDHSSLVFGNKYEGWARFINFMSLYNPTLEEALVSFVRDNRTHEESIALFLMRTYRLTEIIAYYANTLEKTSGNLCVLNEERILFWSDVLQAHLKHQRVSKERIHAYQMRRDVLRSDDEKKRQRGLH